MNTPTTNSPRYVVASLPAWRDCAAQALRNGHTEAGFLALVHPDNANLARTAFRMEAARKVRAIVGNPS